MKHTPGPWFVEINESEDADWSRKWPTIQSAEYEIVGTEGLYGEIETDKANARLIAAAPDLLEALEDCLRVVEFLASDSCPTTIQNATAAIEKAVQP
jgi:hypothetical protein